MTDSTEILPQPSRDKMSRSERDSRRLDANARQFGLRMTKANFMRRVKADWDAAEFLEVFFDEYQKLAEKLILTLQGLVVDSARLRFLRKSFLDVLDAESADHAALVLESKVLAAKLAASPLFRESRKGHVPTVVKLICKYRRTSPKPKAEKIHPLEKAEDGPGWVLSFLESCRAELAQQRVPHQPRQLHYRFQIQPFSKLKLPVVRMGQINIEGVYIPTEGGSFEAVSAYLHRDDANAPAILFCGVPGGGKTHMGLKAVIDRVRDDGAVRFAVIAPTPGSRAQVARLLEQFHAAGMAKVLSKLSDLEGQKAGSAFRYVFVDEAASFNADDVQYLKHCNYIVLAGDPSQRRKDVGMSMLALFAVFGAAVRVLEVPVRAQHPLIALLASRMSAYGSKLIPDSRRFTHRCPIVLLRYEKADVIPKIIMDLVKEDTIVVLFDGPTYRGVKVAAKQAGGKLLAAKVFHSSDCNGAEASRVMFFVPSAFLSNFDAFDAVAIMNAACRGRDVVACITDIRELVEHEQGSWDTPYNVISRFLALFHRPLSPRPSPENPWGPRQWQFLHSLATILAKVSIGIDVLGDMLLLYSESEPERYRSAILFIPNQHNFVLEDAAGQGFEHVCDVNIDAFADQVRQYEHDPIRIADVVRRMACDAIAVFDSDDAKSILPIDLSVISSKLNSEMVYST